MTEVVVDGSAPALPSETATPGAAQTNAATTNPQTDSGEGGEEQSGTPKTFSQQELDEIVKRRVAKAEDRAERRVLRTLEKLQPQQSAPQQASQPQADAKPSRAHYGNDEAYFDALTDWKLEQRDRKAAGDRQQEQQKTLTKKTEGIYAEAQKLAGFDRDAFDELPLTRPMVEALVDADEATAARLMHHMAANPAEVERIGKLSPARQAAELGKLEASLPAARKTSAAPDPITPIGSGKTAIAHDLGKLSMEKYIEQRKKQGARWAN